MKGGDAKVVLAIMVGLAVLLMLMAEPVYGTIDCNHVKSSVSPCVPYLTGNAPKPSANCCNNISALKKEASTTADRRAVCECLKAAASTVPGLKKDLAVGLPKQCGVDTGIPISPDTKCSE
ncbi:non-specific lipid-transfer protein A-like [Prosopis cineraria]|uniref:non-specific lipid-transfer protein A-like n=1 Tax=Prosopis cineraria TaxID=364024 RepID=UPI00240EC1EE|nr:non-specific lipid-transfer protein A-like [Prosopis cineraria]